MAIVIGTSGDDALVGGAQIDAVQFSNSTGAVTVNLELGTSTGFGTDTLLNIENISGSAFDDVLVGDTKDNAIFGAGGNDVLISGAGGDTVIGGAGDDALDGGEGIDSAQFIDATGSVTVNLELGTSTGFGTDTLRNIENVVGSAFGDVLVGDSQNNALSGAEGNDFLIGGDGSDMLNGDAGNDILSGGNGKDILSGGAGDDSLNGGDDIDTAQFIDATAAVTVNLELGASIGFGSDTLVNIENVLGSVYNDVLTGDAQNNTLSGGDGDDIVLGSDGSDTLYGEAGRDILSGGKDKDLLTGGAGDDTLDGGEGMDVASFSGSRSSYELTQAGSSWSISSAAEGTDVLMNIERLQFSDRTVALDISGNAGQAYRVYQAAFNRTPDNDGLKFWIAQMDSGASLSSVAAGFVGSTEFQTLYGANATNEQFITKLYSNVLHRAPDQGGFNFWLAALNSNNVDRVTTLAQFSESPENQAGVIGVILNGIDLL